MAKSSSSSSSSSTSSRSTSSEAVTRRSTSEKTRDVSASTISEKVGAVIQERGVATTYAQRSVSRSSSSYDSVEEHNDRKVKVNTIYKDASDESVAEPGVVRITRKVERQNPVLVHHEEHIQDKKSGRVLKEYEFEEQVAVPYTAIREDIVEHLVAIPTTEEDVQREKIPTKVVEVEKRIPYQTVIEVPTVNRVERVNKVPTPSGRVNKVINYIPVPKVVQQEKKVFIERPVEQIVEVPDITYIDTEEVIQTIEVPEYQDVVKTREVLVPTIVEIPREHIVERDEVTEVDVLIPVGVAAQTKVKYTVPTIVERRSSRGYPVYVPRFIEVPTNSIQLTPDQRETSKKLLEQMTELEQSAVKGREVVSVCEIEKIGVAARDHFTCIQGHIESSDIKKSLLNVFGGEPTTAVMTRDEEPKEKLADDEGYYGHKNVSSTWQDIPLAVPQQTIPLATPTLGDNRSIAMSRRSRRTSFAVHGVPV